MELGLVMSIAAVIAGVIILVWPRFLNYVVAIYLIVVGVIGIIDHLK